MAPSLAEFLFAVRLTINCPLCCYLQLSPIVPGRLSMEIEVRTAPDVNPAARLPGLLLALLALLPHRRCGAPA